MRRVFQFLALAFVVWGLSGCGGGIKEGGPPPNVGYVAPSDADNPESPKPGAPPVHK